MNGCSKAVIITTSVDLIAQYSPEMNEKVLLCDFTGLGITNLQILPHYSRFINKFNNSQQFEIDDNCSVIRLDDGQCVFIINNLFEVV